MTPQREKFITLVGALRNSPTIAEENADRVIDVFCRTMQYVHANKLPSPLVIELNAYDSVLAAQVLTAIPSAYFVAVDSAYEKSLSPLALRGQMSEGLQMRYATSRDLPQNVLQTIVECDLAPDVFVVSLPPRDDPSVIVRTVQEISAHYPNKFLAVRGSSPKLIDFSTHVGGVCGRKVDKLSNGFCLV